MSSFRVALRALAAMLLQLAAVSTFVFGGQNLLSALGIEVANASYAHIPTSVHWLYASALLPCAVFTWRASARMRAEFDRRDDSTGPIRKRAGLPPRGLRA